MNFQCLPGLVKGHVGLRGVAAIAVFGYHLHPESFFSAEFVQWLARIFQWSGSAVDLFFMLSGFILCHVYFCPGKSGWMSFYVARIGRIFPLATAVTLFCVTLDAYSWFRHQIPSKDLEASRILSNLFLVQGWRGNAVENSINPPSWSISIEVFLYVVVYPVLCWVFSLRLTGIRWVRWLALITSLGGATVVAVGQVVPDEFQAVARGSACFAYGFALRLVAPALCSPAVAGKLGILGFAVFGGYLIGLLSNWSSSAVSMIVMGVVCAATIPNGNFVSRMLSLPGMAWLGERSYSIYLIHHPMIVLFGRLFLYPRELAIGGHDPLVASTYFLLVVVSTFGLAEVSYRFFEMPMRRMIRFTKTQSLPVAG